MSNNFSNKVANAVKGVTSFVADKGAELKEKKKHWYIMQNIGLDDDWKDKGQTIIDAADSLGIDWAHVISGAADVSAIGAYCNFEELQKLVDILGIEMDNIRLAGSVEAKLFEHNIHNRL